MADPLCSFSGFLLRFSCQFLSTPFAYSTLWGSPFILPRPLSLQVVEIALKVSPMLGAHMFQPLLPAVFRGIVDGEVSFTFASCSNLRWNCVKGGTCKNMFFNIHHIFNLKFVFQGFSSFSSVNSPSPSSNLSFTVTWNEFFKDCIVAIIDKSAQLKVTHSQDSAVSVGPSFPSYQA